MTPLSQQQYVQLDNKVSGRACFLATNFINILVHTMLLFEAYGSSILYLKIFLGYLITHYVLGVVSAIYQNQLLHKFYKISCSIVSIIHLIICTLSLICIFIVVTKKSTEKTFYYLIWAIYFMILIWSGAEICVDYSNYKFINQLITTSSNQQHLSLPQSDQLAQNHFQ
ncbi:hypothetical protein ABPG72_006592 [Tetrahymena utriculariae]